jgi:hypothetical protein
MNWIPKLLVVCLSSTAPTKLVCVNSIASPESLPDRQELLTVIVRYQFPKTVGCGEARTASVAVYVVEIFSCPFVFSIDAVRTSPHPTRSSWSLSILTGHQLLGKR